LFIVEHSANPFLFASNHEGHSDPDTINKMLKDLAQVANIKIPANKRPSFHAFRKRFLTECANLSIDVNTAKILCGKDVEDSMLAYLSEVDHRAAFMRVNEKLHLTDTPKAARSETQNELEAKVEKLERMINAIAALDPTVVDKARAFVEANIGKYGSEIVLNKALGDMDDNEILAVYWKMIEIVRREQYKELIESNGENGNGAT